MPTSVLPQNNVERIMMKSLMTVASVVTIVGIAPTALAQASDFNLTYHVERTPSAKLSIETCGKVVAQAARQSKLTADSQSFPGQLVIVKGGSGGVGAFTAQCIAVGTTTVTVIQGIDYSGRKGAMGNFTDNAFAAVKQAAKR